MTIFCEKVRARDSVGLHKSFSQSMAQKSYKLLYFAARGRGEFIRLAFIIAGVEFEDCRLDKEKWDTLKAGEFNHVQNIVLVRFCLHTTDTIKMKRLDT